MEALDNFSALIKKVELLHLHFFEDSHSALGVDKFERVEVVQELGDGVLLLQLVEAHHSLLEVRVVLFKLYLVAFRYHLVIGGALFMLGLVLSGVVLLKLDHELVALWLK